MKFIIPGTPISKDRPRYGCTRDRRPYMYDPQKPAMDEVRDTLSQQFAMALEGENQQISIKASEIASSDKFDVGLVFIFSPPRSLTVGHKNALLWGIGHNNHKPDLDNMEKFYLDCVTQAGIWRDDAQVVSLNSKKIYAEFARTEMEIVAKKDFTVKKLHMRVLCVFSPGEISQLLQDASSLSAVIVNGLEEKLGQEAITYQSSALIAFANKYADRLMRVKKIAAKEIEDEIT